MNTSSPTADINLNISTNHANQDKTNHILDVMFDYTANGDDELTLRLLIVDELNSFFY